MRPPLLLAWAAVLGALAFALLRRPGDAAVARTVAAVLGALALFACVMLLGPDGLLRRFARVAGICAAACGA